jgi:Tfp pilus assembly protein PilE
VLIGILVALTMGKIYDIKERAAVTAMQADLHSLALAQELYFEATGLYAGTLDALPQQVMSDRNTVIGFYPAPRSVTMIVGSNRTSRQCAIGIGEGLSSFDNTPIVNKPTCTP